MIRGIHHVALNTADLGRMVRFYTEVIGFVPVSEVSWEGNDLIDRTIGVPNSAAKTVMLKAGNAYLEIFEYSSPPHRDTGGPLRPCDRGYTHIALDIVGIDAEFERLKRAGMKLNERVGDFGELKAIYAYDPDGNVVELQEVIAADHPFRLTPA